MGRRANKIRELLQKAKDDHTKKNQIREAVRLQWNSEIIKECGGEIIEKVKAKIKKKEK